MNQAQRKFLIDRIRKEYELKVKALENSLPEYPSEDKFILHKIMSNDFEIQPAEHIKKAIIAMAINPKDDWNGMGGSFRSTEYKKRIALKFEDLFVIPEELSVLRREYVEKTRETKGKIERLTAQFNALEIRINLASDKTLQKMISDVDDMGDLSLMDTKLRLLSD